MLFRETCVQGAYVVEPEVRADHRGGYARFWCREEFGSRGLATDLPQANFAYTHQRGTLRGLHYQAAPSAEAKLIRCTRGAIYDVVLDMREDSPTRGRWYAVELTDENRRMLYVPEGCAHGYQTLTDGAEVAYFVSAPYAPQAERGVRYDDPAFRIEWPLPVSVISEKDTKWPDYTGAAPHPAPTPKL